MAAAKVYNDGIMWVIRILLVGMLIRAPSRAEDSRNFLGNTNVIRRHGSGRGISHFVIVIRESLWPAVYEDASRARESPGKFWLSRQRIKPIQPGCGICY